MLLDTTRWFRDDNNARNGSREKKQRKAKTKMGERHHRYVWYDGSSKQSGGGQALISQINLGSDVLPQRRYVLRRSTRIIHTLLRINEIQGCFTQEVSIISNNISLCIPIFSDKIRDCETIAVHCFITIQASLKRN